MFSKLKFKQEKAVMSMSSNDGGDDSTKDGPTVRRRVSIVWAYFEKLSRTRVRCKLCRHEQNYQGTTGNILRHLKNKHNLDATVRGQNEDPAVMERFKDQLNESSYSLNAAVKHESSQLREARNKVKTYCEESDIDPYAETDMALVDCIDSNVVSCAPNEDQCGATATATAPKRKGTIEEERLIAEIEYFREKAAYYRMQKNLTALQAKKVKFELDQMV